MNFPGKIPETGKIYFKFFPSPNSGPKPTHQSRSNSICRVPLQISPACFFFLFRPPLKLRVVYLRNKQTNFVTNMEFYKHVQYCFCCYVIKSAGEIAKKVLLSIFWNLLRIQINLSQIRISYSKHEKACAVWPYLLFHSRITAKIKDSSHRNNFNISIFSKIAPTILIKFSGFIVHSKPNNMTL